MTFDSKFYPLNLQIDIVRLVAETDSLINLVPLAFERTRQLSLQARPGSADPWYEGCRKQSQIGSDLDYCELNSQLADSYFADLFRSLPFRPFRARLMSLDPSICYSVHKDTSPRYHVAIHTSEHAQFVFTDMKKTVHIPADGRVYFVDTRENHTAFNGGSSPRLHLVFGGPADHSEPAARGD